MSRKSDEDRTDQPKNEDPELSRPHFLKFRRTASDGDGRTSRSWECGTCGKEFPHRSALVRHLASHSEEKKFACAECDSRFAHRSTLAQHAGAVHRPHLRPYACPECGRTFARSSVLHAHRKTHSDAKGHECQTCGKGFTLKANLAAHELTHGGERPHRCAACGHGFNQKSNLKAHVKRAHKDLVVTSVSVSVITGPDSDRTVPTARLLPRPEDS